MDNQINTSRGGYMGAIRQRTCRTCRDDHDDGRKPDTCGKLNGCALAMVYSPLQTFNDLYEPQEALSRGTLFRELDKPLEVGRRCSR